MIKVADKILDLENKFKKIVTNNKNLIRIFVVCLVLVAIFTRFLLLKYKSPDYIIFLSQWFEKLENSGGLPGLKYNFGDYNIPYMTILALLTYIPISSLYSIKIVSIIFDFICAFFASKIVNDLKPSKDKVLSSIIFCIVLLTPTVILDSTLWAQCDIIYTSFVLGSIHYVLKNKIKLSFIFLGLAFAFKLQFIFILPIYIALYFYKKDISILHFLLIPLIDIILCIPAVIAGRSIIDCLLIYFNQTGEYTALTLNYPNLYSMLGGFFDNQRIILILLTSVVIGFVLFYIFYKKINITKNFIPLALLLSLLTFYFLPGMHERYGFMIEILSIIYVVIYKRDYYLPIVLQISALVGYYSFLAPNSLSPQLSGLMPIILFIAIIKFSYNSIKRLNDEV